MKASLFPRPGNRQKEKIGKEQAKGIPCRPLRGGKNEEKAESREKEGQTFRMICIVRRVYLVRMVRPVCIVRPVRLVYLVHLVYLVYLVRLASWILSEASGKMFFA